MKKNENSLQYFYNDLNFFLKKAKSHEVIAYIEGFRNRFPKGVFYQGNEEELLEGEKLISYYDTKIPEITPEFSPYERLHRLFSSLTKVDYVAQMSLGDKKNVSKKAAKRERSKDRAFYERLFKAIELRKPDVAVPKGKEAIYYAHLEKILKHIALHLEKCKDKNETFVFLKDIVACSGACYTHFSTAFHSMYTRISHDELFHQVTQKQEDHSVLFFNRFKKYLKNQFQSSFERMFGSEDIHVRAVIQNILIEGNYPLFGQKVIDRESMKLGAILQIRNTILDIPEEKTLELLMLQEHHLYPDTKKRFLFMLSDVFCDLKFFSSVLESFLKEGLNKEGMEEFLYQLNAWLESNGIADTHRLLKYHKNGSYSVKAKGIMLMLQKIPTQIPLD